jgi:tRNA(Ile)-lysidine synthase
MQHDFLKYIDDNNLVEKGDRVLLAVSGGIDSMVMTDLFVRAGIETGLAHCNFGLRGRESDKDEALVRKYAENAGIPFYSIRFKTDDYAYKNGISIQMAARELRYRWFEEIRKKNKFDSIAVAHNLNDNIETILINMTRGTGIAGLTGMKAISNQVIRPLLFATRHSIEEYRKKYSIKYREDSSNTETKYIRNKIRHLVIPLLKEINPAIEITLIETAERLNGINEIVTVYIDGISKSVLKKVDKNSIAVDLNQLLPYLKNSAILYELFKKFGITNNTLKDLYKIIKGRTGIQLFTGTHRFLKNRQEIIISKDFKTEDKYYKISSVSELMIVPGIISAGITGITDSFSIPDDQDTACLDSKKISFPLVIRSWLPGDYFYPLGMKKKKKLSDYFIDRKYSLIDKENILILESDGRIVWILGERIDNRFRITKSTTRGLIIKAEPHSGPADQS